MHSIRPDQMAGSSLPILLAVRNPQILFQRPFVAARRARSSTRLLSYIFECYSCRSKGRRSQKLVSAGRAVFTKGKQREFLKHAKELSKLNWELFASHIGVSSYNVLRATYLNERNTLPVAVLGKAAHLFKDATLCNQIVGFRPAHWGQSKGGSISLKKWACDNAQETEVISRPTEPSLPQGSVL